MRIVLQGCQHLTTETFGGQPQPGEPWEWTATCLSCYRRLKVQQTGLTILPAPAPCAHEQRRPVNTKLTQKTSYRDAMCLACGCVLRHPDGPGSWSEVISYGYVIAEQP